MAPELKGKGIRGSVRRAGLLPMRYGVGAERIRARLREMTALLERWELTPTIPATAVALDRHPEILTEYASADPAIHGYHHVSYAGSPREAQARDLDAACDAFARHGLPTHGFRAPYLRADGTTRTLLRQRGFEYDSSAVWFALPVGHPATVKAMGLTKSRYGNVTTDPALPVLEDGLVELPVALPDDEILVDGLGIGSSATLGRVIGTMLEIALRSGALLVLQIHPERFHFFSDALEDLLRQAADAGAWMASLSEIANWTKAAGGRKWPDGRSMGLAISGDLDAVALTDFGHRILEG